MSESTLKQYLAENPKMTGILFTIVLLLSQAGAVAAGALDSYPGP